MGGGYIWPSLKSSFINYMNATSLRAVLVKLLLSEAQCTCPKLWGPLISVEPLPCTHRQGQLKLLPHRRTLQFSCPCWQQGKWDKTQGKESSSANQDGAWAVTRSPNLTAEVRGRAHLKIHHSTPPNTWKQRLPLSQRVFCLSAKLLNLMCWQKWVRLVFSHLHSPL